MKAKSLACTEIMTCANHVTLISKITDALFDTKPILTNDRWNSPIKIVTFGKKFGTHIPIPHLTTLSSGNPIPTNRSPNPIDKFAHLNSYSKTLQRLHRPSLRESVHSNTRQLQTTTATNE